MTRPVLALIVAVAAISTAAILVRLVPDVHPVAAAFWRTAAVCLLLAPSVARLSLPVAAPPARRLLGLTMLAGGLLAAHFSLWFISLHHTTVLRSTLLVCLAPLWTGVFEWVLRGQRPPAAFWVGVTISLGGVAWMGTGDDAAAPSLLGDGLALLGGTLSAAYLVVGRVVRPWVSIGPYGSAVCGAAALWLGLAAAIGDVPVTGFSPRVWLALGAMALGPQLLGHIGLNYAVRYLPAALVAAVTLLEPAGAAALGAALLDEIPSRRAWAGSAGAIVGVAVATLGWRGRSG